MQEMMENMKKCNKCLEVKGIDGFCKRKAIKGGIISCCKTCMNEYYAKYREVNPEKVKKKAAKYREANPEKVKKDVKKWHKANPEKVKENHKKGITNLTDYYIKNQLKAQNYPQELINNPEFIEVKRLIIKTKRLCRTSRN